MLGLRSHQSPGEFTAALLKHTLVKRPTAELCPGPRGE